MEIFDILINDEPRFEDNFKRTGFYKRRNLNWILIQDADQFLKLYDIMEENTPFRLWIHPGMFNNPEQQTQKGKPIKNTLKGVRKTRNLKYYFLTRATIPKSPIDNDGVLTYSLDNVDNEEELRIEDLQVNVKGQSLVEQMVKDNITDYVAGDPLSAISKAKKLLSYIKEYDIEIENCGFISLGGGDGTELLFEMENSPCKWGYLLEYDSKSVDRFNEKYKKQFTARFHDKNLKVRECDVFNKDKFDELKADIFGAKLSGIIVSIHALIHELPMRSKLKHKFDLNTFISRLKDLHKNVFIIIREPSTAENWGKEVWLEVPESKNPDFLKILTRVNEALFNKQHIEQSGDLYKLDTDLCIETLTKYFYREDIDYEIGEKVTSFSRNDIQTQLLNCDFTILETISMLSDSVRRNFRKHDIRVMDSNNQNILLPYPLCFAYIIAAKGFRW